MGRIADARSRWHGVEVEQARFSPPLTCDQLAAVLSTSVKGCQLWRANWRNRIYRVTLGDGTVAVAKQACVEQGAKLRCEFASLHRLATLQLPHLRVPQPIAYLSTQQAYLMELAPGASLDCLLRQGRTRDFVRACGLAGGALAGIHNAWSTSHQPLSADAMAADLLSIPLPLGHGQRQTIRAAMQVLSEGAIPMGQPYLDYKTANILFDGSSLWLIDPPEEEVEDELLAWDVAVFTVSVDHELWKCLGRGPLKARKLANVGISQFERMYRRHLVGACLSLPEFCLLTQVAKLQRVGQLIALQRSKLQSGCRRTIPFTSRQSRLWGALAESMPLPLLAAHAHRLIFQMSKSSHRSASLHLARG